MTKVTNNENMRRYVHMKLSKNGSGDSGSDSGCNCLQPMIVRGASGSDNTFIPETGAPTWLEAKEHMLQGGIVYLYLEEEEEGVLALCTGFYDTTIEATLDGTMLWYAEPNESPFR